jgi:hypothetical protein
MMVCVEPRKPDTPPSTKGVLYRMEFEFTKRRCCNEPEQEKFTSWRHTAAQFVAGPESNCISYDRIFDSGSNSLSMFKVPLEEGDAKCGLDLPRMVILPSAAILRKARCLDSSFEMGPRPEMDILAFASWGMILKSWFGNWGKSKQYHCEAGNPDRLECFSNSEETTEARAETEGEKVR